jgi:hypothetical protein
MKFVESDRIDRLLHNDGGGGWIHRRPTLPMQNWQIFSMSMHSHNKNAPFTATATALTLREE